MIGDVDVHSFREEKNYVVDVAFQQAEKPSAAAVNVGCLASSGGRAATTAMTARPCPTRRRPRRPLPKRPPPWLRHRRLARSCRRRRRCSPSRPTSRSIPITRRRHPRPKPRCRRPRQRSRRLLRSKPRQDGCRGPGSGKHAGRRAPAEMPLAAPAPAPAPEIKSGGGQTSVSARRDSDGLRLTFSFPAATPAALFRRADTVWLLFDSTKPIDVEPIRSQGGSVIADVSVMPLEKGQAIRFRLNRPQLPSLTGEDRAGRHELDGHLRRCHADAVATA